MIWDRVCLHQINIEATQSSMRWYVRKNYLKWVEIAELPIWCEKVFFEPSSVHTIRALPIPFLCICDVSRIKKRITSVLPYMSLSQPTKIIWLRFKPAYISYRDSFSCLSSFVVTNDILNMHHCNIFSVPHCAWPFVRVLKFWVVQLCSHYSVLHIFCCNFVGGETL